MRNGLPTQLGPFVGDVRGTDHTQVAVYEPEDKDIDIVRWVTAHRPALMELLESYGAVLIRNAVDNPELLDRVSRVVGAGDLLEYTERSTPRSVVSGNVYTSTEYPANQTIPQHNENSYAHQYPLWLFFACALASETGGETPLADSRAVVDRLPADLVRRFRDKGVLYTRAYREGMGLTWQETFQTQDRGEVEEFCRRHGMEFEWTGGDGLRTRHHRPATARAASGEEVWFNQAHLFHVSNLAKGVREALLEMYDEQDLPRHAYYGDGSPISDDDMAAIRGAFDETCHQFPWRNGDLLVINNLLMSHGRRPYTGKRRILVAMAGTAA
ncbi:TauD/TfdA family dioxygenase [Amycolatopsis samaneae]|uniref:TauD/TfdA family dioxygenase n=1 Tax=Amycolatopsis samaneae TaxID=664691 RepID=A0ABW5GRF7_9PSEU